MSTQTEKNLIRPIAKDFEVGPVADTGKSERFASVFTDLAVRSAGDLSIQLPKSGQVGPNRFAAVLMDVDKTAKGDNGLTVKFSVPEGLDPLLEEFKPTTTSDKVFAVDLPNRVCQESPSIELGRLGGMFRDREL
jgi:hypothetical protein